MDLQGLMEIGLGLETGKVTVVDQEDPLVSSEVRRAEPQQITSLLSGLVHPREFILFNSLHNNVGYRITSFLCISVDNIMLEYVNI